MTKLNLPQSQTLCKMVSNIQTFSLDTGRREMHATCSFFCWGHPSPSRSVHQAFLLLPLLLWLWHMHRQGHKQLKETRTCAAKQCQMKVFIKPLFPYCTNEGQQAQYSSLGIDLYTFYNGWYFSYNYFKVFLRHPATFLCSKGEPFPQCWRWTIRAGRPWLAARGWRITRSGVLDTANQGLSLLINQQQV